jgi:starch-binding outer membrane protein SusE/F
MKLFINKYFIALLSAMVLLGACKRDIDNLVANQGKVPVLTSDKTTLVLLQANKDDEAVTFTWTKQFWGVNTGNVVYTIQMIKEGTSWNSPGSEVSVGELLTKTFTVGELNRELLKFIDPPGNPESILFRVKSEVSNSDAITYSNAVKLTITSYRDIILYTFPAALNVAGNFQGWNPGTAPQIVNTKNGGFAPGYEGYINFTNATPEFKLVKGDNWGAGDYGDAGGGNLTVSGGPNLTLPLGAGVYRLRVNAARTTWSYDKINTFGIIGSFNGWSTSLPMTMDANGNWSVTVDFPANTEFKFRANNDWAINFGDNGANGEPDYGGDNIVVAAAGNYTIRLNIGVAGNYNYTIKKN